MTAAALRGEAAPRQPGAPATLPVLVAQALLAAAAIGLFLYPLATRAGLVAGVTGTILAYFVARRATTQRLRLVAAVVLGALGALLAHTAADFLLAHPMGLRPGTAIPLADAVYFGVGLFAVFFALRCLSERARVASVLEVAVVVGAAAQSFAGHRQHRIHQPRAFADWAWMHGLDPTQLLLILGAVAMGLAAFLLLRYQRPAKLLLSLLVLALLIWGATRMSGSLRIEPDVETGLGLTNQDGKDGKGGGAGGGGSGERPKPNPVAVAILRDDFDRLPDVLYFRQTVLSKYDGHRLSADTSGAFDKDVLGRYPRGETVTGEQTQEEALHRRLPTSMYLLAEHPQPVALTHSIELRPLENPNPRQFVAAYDVVSAIPTDDVERYVGRTAGAAMSPETLAHYTAIPDDPRYASLANEIVRGGEDPRQGADSIHKALAIRRYLGKHGFYTRKERHESDVDPAASFLFGSMRGYCVHFAHSAVYLMRSQGIPARVALGYGVQMSLRGSGTSILILASEAHAWPEIYIDGVGWTTFDIYPERSDEPPPQPIDQDLESMLGELARKDKSAGLSPEPLTAGLVVPWQALGFATAGALLAALLGAYLVKAGRRLAPAFASPRSRPRLEYRAVLDALADLGAPRRDGETRERHAARLAPLAPTLPRLTTAHLRLALGGHRPAVAGEVSGLAAAVRVELKESVPLARRLVALLHPVGWWWTK